MDNIDESIYYPLEVGKEIGYMLYNYNDLDNIIEKKKNDLIDKINVSSTAWLKGRNMNNNTLENIVIKFQTDKNIKRLKKWKEFLTKFLAGMKDYDNKIYYSFIDMKYFQKKDKIDIMETLKLNEDEYHALKVNLKWVIYNYASKNKLYKMVK